MSRAVWPMPVSVEQIAVVVQRMSPEERRRLVVAARPYLSREAWERRLVLSGVEGSRGQMSKGDKGSKGRARKVTIQAGKKPGG